MTKVALVRVHGNSQAWKTAVRLWQNQVRAVLGRQAVDKNAEDTPLEPEYEQLVPKTTPLDHAAWADDSRVATEGGRRRRRWRGRRFGKRAFNQCGARRRWTRFCV